MQFQKQKNKDKDKDFIFISSRVPIQQNNERPILYFLLPCLGTMEVYVRIHGDASK